MGRLQKKKKRKETKTQEKVSFNNAKAEDDQDYHVLGAENCHPLGNFTLLQMSYTTQKY